MNDYVDPYYAEGGGIVNAPYDSEYKNDEGEEQSSEGMSNSTLSAPSQECQVDPYYSEGGSIINPPYDPDYYDWLERQNATAGKSDQDAEEPPTAGSFHSYPLPQAVQQPAFTAGPPRTRKE